MWAHIKVFWPRKIRLKVTITQAAGSFRFCGDTAEQQVVCGDKFGKSVDKFVMAPNATQSSTTALTQQNAHMSDVLPVIQNKLSMVCHQLHAATG